jgi:hypothetical protein
MIEAPARVTPTVERQAKQGAADRGGRPHSNGWTPERRAHQAALIRAWKPWEKSTGPKTEEGKAIVSKNHLKSRRSRVRQLMPAFQLAVFRDDVSALLQLIEVVARPE